MKPAFPTVVYWMPNCWKLLAAKRANPQAMPPSHRSRLLYGVGDTAFSEGVDEDSGIAESVAAEDLSSGTVQDKEHRNQDSGADQGTDAVKSKRAYIFHAYTLGDKGDSPDGSGQKQAERIFQRHFLCVHDKRILSRIMWSKRYIRKDPGELQIASRGIFMICRNRVRQN